MCAVGVATLNANSVKKQSINAKSEPSDWQYLGVDKITRRLEWNSGRKARKGHICEDSLAYASYSSKDVAFVSRCDTLMTWLFPSPSVGHQLLANSL